MKVCGINRHSLIRITHVHIVLGFDLSTRCPRSTKHVAFDVFLIGFRPRTTDLATDVNSNAAAYKHGRQCCSWAVEREYDLVMHGSR